MQYGRITLAALLAVLLVSFSACTDDAANSPGSEKVANIDTNKILSVVSGTVVETEREREDGIDVIEVKVRTAGGAIVEIECVAETGELLEIEGESPPFDYEVTPGNGLILFSEARGIALNGRNASIREWELEREENDTRWMYIFELKEEGGVEIEVRIDAVSGEIVDVRTDD